MQLPKAQSNARTAQKKKPTMHQVPTTLATSINFLFPRHNHLQTTGTDDPTLWLSLERQRYLVDSSFLAQWPASCQATKLFSNIS